MGQITLVVQSTSVVTPWPQVHGLLPGLWILERKNLIWVQKNYNNSWKKYHFEVPYGRVFRGKEKALDIIYGKWDDVTSHVLETLIKSH
jgi:hypothetical protein